MTIWFISGRATEKKQEHHNCRGFLSAGHGSGGALAAFARCVAAAFLVVLVCACSGGSDKDFLAEGQKLMAENNPAGAVVLLKNALEKSPTDYTIRLELARAYLALGKGEQAEVELQKCLRQKPDDPTLHREFARLQVMMRKPEEALAHLESAKKWLAPTAESLELAGLAHGLDNNLPAAAQALEQAIALEPKRESAILALARVRLAQREPGKALELVDGLLAATPQNEPALNLRGDIAMRMGDNAKAISCFQRLTQIQPKREEYRYLLGTLLLQQGNVPAAREQLAALRTNAGETAMAFMLEGLAAYTEQNYPASAAAFQRSVSMAPTLEGHYRLALAQHRTGDLETALSNARKTLDYLPDYVPALRLVCTILMQQNRLEDAQREAERLVQHYPTADSHYLLGSVLRARGKQEEALKEYETAASLDPNLEEAFLQRSAMLFDAGKMEEAEKGLREAVQHNADSQNARRALFSFYLGRRQFDQAEQVVRQGLEKQPNDAVLLTMLATLQVVRNDNKDALDTVEKARAIAPDYLPAFSLALRLHTLAGDTGKALAICEDYLARHPEATAQRIIAATLLNYEGKKDEAERHLRDAWQRGDSRALTLLVQHALARDDAAQAQALLRDALAARPNSSVRQSLARLYLGADQFDKAWELYTSLEATQPEEAAAGKFRLLTAMGKHQEALNEARNAQRNFPASPLGVILAAEALEHLGKPAEAMDELQRAYASTEHTPLLLLMAQLCLRQNELDKAEALYRAVLQKEKNNLPALSGQAYTMLLRKNYDAAIQGYEQVLVLNPEDALAANNLAMAYILAGKDSERALRLATVAYTFQPENPTVLDTLGQCLMRNKRFTEAVTVLEQAVSAAPDSAALRYRLGAALAESNQPAKAREALQKALETGDFAEAEEARKLLGTLK